jgi:hypothetical protein
MLLPTELIEELNKFTSLTIEYHKTHKKYRVNSLWLDDIELNYFKTNVKELLDNLQTILISSNNNLLIVDQIKILLEEKLTWHTLNQIQNFKSFNKLIPLIIEVNYDVSYDASEAYSIDKVINFVSTADKIENLYLYTLIAHKDRTKNYADPADFENVKLHFILNQFYKSIEYLLDKIEKIKVAIQVYGVSDLSHYIPKSKIEIPDDEKCIVNLDKISVAFLFKFLVDKKFIQMDSHRGRNESKIKKFAEKNFNFKEASNIIKPLTGLTREYSKVSNANRKEKQLEVLEKLSKAISEQKKYLEVVEISLGDPHKNKV